jgi:hypothetical protein
MQGKECCLLVHSGDRGRWVWPYWYQYWKKYWGAAAEYVDTVFLGESGPFVSGHADGIIGMYTGPVAWADGLQYALTHLRYPYIIYHHEDYFLTEPVDVGALRGCIHTMKQHELNMMKICGPWAGDNQWQLEEDYVRTNIACNGHPVWIYPETHDYLVSHQSAIWKKNFLSSTLQAGESPWQHELDGTPRLRDRNIAVHAYRAKAPIEYCETVQGNRIRENCEIYFPDERVFE